MSLFAALARSPPQRNAAGVKLSHILDLSHILGSGVSLFAALARSPPQRNAAGVKLEGTHTIRRVMLYHNQFSHQTMQVMSKEYLASKEYLTARGHAHHPARDALSQPVFAPDDAGDE